MAMAAPPDDDDDDNTDGWMVVISDWEDIDQTKRITAVLLVQGTVIKKDIGVKIENGGRSLRFVVPWPTAIADADKSLEIFFERKKEKMQEAGIEITSSHWASFVQERTSFEKTLGRMKSAGPMKIEKSYELPFEVEQKFKSGFMKLNEGAGLMWVEMKAPVIEKDEHDDY